MTETDFGPYPDFSWSRSRHDALAVCARRYFYRYYGSWRGWEDDAPAVARRAYLLKNLTGLAAELGRSVHRRAFEVGFKAAQGLEPPGVEELLRRTRDELNGVVLSSRDRRGFLDRPSRHPFFRSAWYGNGPGEGEIERTRRRLEESHRALAGHGLWGVVRRGEAEVEFLADPDVVPDPRLEVDGVPVYGEPDLVLRPRDGPAVVVDWKSGREREQDLWQLAVQGLWLRSVAGDAGCVGRVEYLAEGTFHELELGEDELEEAGERIRRSVGEMRELVADRERNEPRPREAFPLTERRSVCRWCDFFELCEDELKSTGGVPEAPGGEGGPRSGSA